MPSVITDPQAYARTIMARRKALQQAQGASSFTATVPAPDAIVPPGVVSPQPQQALDPAQAGAQGYRIPGDYIPDAQTAGGSGTYMSKVPSGASQPSRGGIGSDYVAGGPQSPDVASTGSIAAQDNGADIFSFFGKPQATDAMTAFGAAMLKGKNFAEGLADASTAVNNVAMKYRPYTDAEVQRMMQEAAIKARYNRKLAGKEVDTKSPMYDKNNVLYLPGVDENGNPFFYNTVTKEYQATAEGLRRATDAELGAANRSLGTAQGKAIGNFELQVQSAPAKIATYDQMLSKIDSAGVGTDVLTQTAGRLSELTGMNVAGVDLTDRGVLKSLIASQQLVASEALRGQGQVTEAERALLARSLIEMESNPESARQVLTILKKAEERKMDQFRKWNALRQTDPNASFTQFLLDYKTQLDSSEGKQSSGSSQAPSSQSGNKPSLDDIFK